MKKKEVKISNKIKESASRYIFQIANYLFLAVLSLLCVFPFLHLLAVSFSSDSFASAGLVGIFPKGFCFDAYKLLVNQKEFFKALGISVLRTILGTAFSLIVIILTAYPLSKTNKQVKGRTIFSWFFIITFFFSGGLAATYVLYDTLGLIDSFLVYILPNACDVWFVFMLANFFRDIPKDLEEAALMDGCNQVEVLFKIYLPLSLPALVTIILFTAVGQWNNWFDGMLFMNDPSKYPLQSYLYTMIISSDPSKLIAAGGQLTPEQLEALQNIGGKNLQAAQIFLGMLPITLVYPFLQRYFIKGITVGSVKG